MKQPLSERLAAYKALLSKYHKTLDLLSDAGLAALDGKIEDSLVYAAVLEAAPQNRVVLDIGSGNGLPGIPMALALPRFKFHLVERRQRRATFLSVLKSQLNLDNVKVHACSIEAVADLQVDTVTALAVGSLTVLYCLSRHLHQRNVSLLSRKGADFSDEIEQLEKTLGINVAELKAIPLATNGTLVAVKLAGGRVCRL